MTSTRIACLSVSMIQNISQDRQNKAITKRDIRQITYAAFMAYYTGSQQFRVGTDNNKYPLGHHPFLSIAYVKGLSGNRAQVLWDGYCYGYSATSPNSSTSSFSTKISNNALYMKLSYKCGEIYDDPKSIHTDLEIGENETKIILRTHFFTAEKYGDDTAVKDNLKRLFGFHLLPIRLNSRYFFSEVVIFTPNQGLFSETLPQ